MLAIEVTSEWLDHKHIRAHFANYPRRFKPAINKRYVELYTAKGRAAANILLLDTTDAIGGNKALMAANDSEICTYAKSRSQACFDAAVFWVEADSALAAMYRIAERAGIEVRFKDTVTAQGQRARLLCEIWWRRQIRKTIARQVESAAINLGLVSKRAGIYASDETVSRRAGQRRRNARLLDSLIAENDEGQAYTLAELSKLGVSNPEIRRMELMTRLAGFDAYAVSKGHAAEFYTITAPSRFHAVKSDGKPNRKYTKESPKEAQQHLCKGWALARAALAKKGVKLYGFRVAEPHHDGTPHWHMVMFFAADWMCDASRKAMPRVRAIIRRYALREDGREFGARKHRFQAEKIDRKKGSAAGYLAKYISKNINAKGVEGDEDFEGGFLLDNARRVDAWASCWGIRQFQQVGGAPVGVWRELRRLADSICDGGLGLLARAADAGNWEEYTRLMGGALAGRKDMAARVRRVWFDERTRYDGEGLFRVDGVESCLNAEFEKTRLRRWVVKRALAPAWSSVNNCNQVGGTPIKNGGGKWLQEKLEVENIDQMPKGKRHTGNERRPGLQFK